MERIQKPLLEVSDLSVSFRMYDSGLEQKQLPVISSLSLKVLPGEILAVAGSSGSGKSLLASAILGILPGNATVSGSLRFDGEPLTPERQAKLRGTEIALVPQSVAFLDPLMKVGAQVDGHRKPRPTERRRKLFRRFGLPEQTERLYPFQLSGGMARRVLVSTALLTSARLIIADEPTPGMSLEQAEEALAMFRAMADEGKGVVLITHDIDLAFHIADRIAVFYAGTTVETAPAADFRQIGANMEDAFTIDADAFANAIEMNMDENELTELLRSMMTAEDASFDGNLNSFGYADLSKPAQIDIYPLDFESKESIAEILGAYNSRMTGSGQEEKVISYTDLVGTMMSSMTEIVNTISYVLVAFVAISLVVSSIMIGVITYISVLERKKEIGILRAIGASKGNISQVFNAEAFIIGLCAGLIGIGMTLLLLIPCNALIHSMAGSTDIHAVLPAANAVVLILLSVVLTLIGGLIPSRKAAKSDPVAALRAD